MKIMPMNRMMAGASCRQTGTSQAASDCVSAVMPPM
jgi:hypothetical protein